MTLLIKRDTTFETFKTTFKMLRQKPQIKKLFQNIIMRHRVNIMKDSINDLELF